MEFKSDAQLLRAYAVHGEEAAFTELVTRYTNLVYSAAARQTDSPDSAAEVSQRVFIALARGARDLSARLSEDASLAGWLCRSARNISLNHRRDEFRQHHRERQAMAQLDSNSEPLPDWDRLRPVLDEALSELNETDHDALVQRFFNNHDYRTIGRALGISDDTAQKRISRALDKLREQLSRRGIQGTAATLSAVLSTNAVQVAPVGLSAAISAAVSVSLPSAITHAIAMTTFQKIIIAAVSVALISATTYEARQNSTLRGQMRSMQEQTAPLGDQIHGLQKERDDFAGKLAALQKENGQLRSNLAELPKLRGDVSRLRNQPSPGNDPNYAQTKEIEERVNKIKQRLLERPEAKVPEFRFLKDSDYWDATRFRPLNSEEAYLAALSNLRSSAEFTFVASILNPALTQYAKANHGEFPTALSQLQPYFTSPVEDAILDRWEIAPAGTVPTAHYGDPIITLKTAVDEDWDPRYVVGLTNFGSAGVDTSGHNGWGAVNPERLLGPSFDAALVAYRNANNGQNPKDPMQVQQYLNLTTPEQQAAWQKLLKWHEPK